MRYSILVVDDDKEMRHSLTDLLEAVGWQVDTVSRAEKALDHLKSATPDVILSDVRMPGMSGLELLAKLDPNFAPPLILISAHGDIPMAVQAIQDGAYGFLEKPYHPKRLLTVLQHAAEQSSMRSQNARLKARLLELSGLDRLLVGGSPAVQELRAAILDYAAADAPVLIQGETGTGKDLVARALHDLGPMGERPFLAINCATLNADTFEADMFGTFGAQKGRLQAADGGTLFLDEICACPMDVQAKLLRVIEDKQILPIGSPAPVAINLRIISATNENVENAVAAGHFRRDLMFRLNTFVVDLPNLRQRRDDITLLTAHFLNDFARIYECEPPELTPDDFAALLAHDWPGNIRELRSVCERRVLSARRGGGTMISALRSDTMIEDVPHTLRAAVAAFERELIAKAIKAHQGRMDAAAEALGIGRRTLNEKIVKLGLDKDALL